MKYAKPKGAFLYDLAAGASLSLSDTCVTENGIVHANKGAVNITLRNVYTQNPPPNHSGAYVVLLATHTVQKFLWDNTGLKDKYIVNGGEAALRIMGRAKYAEIVGVDFHCRRWTDDKGRDDWWKEVVQLRDVDEVLMRDLKIIGPVSIGRQKDPGGVKQHVGKVTFRNVGLTDWPRITDHATVGSVHYENCYWIDEHGKPTGKKIPNR